MAALDRWHVEFAQRLRVASNLSALALTLLVSIVLLSGLSRHQLEPDQLHSLALANAVAYAIAHWLRRRRHALLERRGDEAALIARLAYRNPTHVSDLDLAAYWVAFAVLAPALAWAGGSL